MGISPFVSKCCCGQSGGETPGRKPGAPDPQTFIILRTKQIGSYLVAEVVYPDCMNYEGRKILLYENVRNQSLMVQPEIDPHFCDSPGCVAPIARFEPTARGWAMAETLAVRGLRAGGFLVASNGGETVLTGKDETG